MRASTPDIDSARRDVKAARSCAGRAAALAACLAVLLVACTDKQTEFRDDADELERATALYAQGDITGSAQALKAAIVQRPDWVEARWMLGEIHLLTHQPAAAEKEFMRVATLGRDGPELQRRLVLARLRQGKTDAVLDATATVDTPDMIVLRAMAQRQSGQTDAAVRNFTRALRRDPSQVEAEIGLAGIARDGRDAYLADFHLKRALELAPKTSEAWSLTGLLERSRQAPGKAERAFLKAYEVNAFEVVAIAGLVQVALIRDTPADAFEWLDRLDQILPDSNEGGFLRAYALYRSGQTDAAKDRLRGVLSRAPEHAGSMFLLAMLLYEDGRPNQADALLTQFMREHAAYAPAGTLRAAIRSDDGALYSEAGVFATFSEQEQLAIAGIAVLTPTEPATREDRRRRATEYLRQGFLHAAEGLLIEDSAAHTQDGEMLSQLARLYVAIDDRRAGETAARAYALALDDPEVLHTYGWVLANLHEFDRAIALLDRAVELGADTGSVHYHRAAAYALADNLDGVESSLRPTLAREDRYAERKDARALWRRLAREHFDQGRAARATALLEESIAADPRDVDSLNQLARIYSILEDPRAVTVASQAYQLSPDAPTVLHTYGWTLVSTGRAEQGLRLLDEAVQRGANSPSMHYHRGAALAETGDREAARSALEQALASESEFIERDAAARLLEQL